MSTETSRVNHGQAGDTTAPDEENHLVELLQDVGFHKDFVETEGSVSIAQTLLHYLLSNYWY